ncbi:hypothetical protein ACFL3V_05080 [Nanoarchaeota archaeon]
MNNSTRRNLREIFEAFDDAKIRADRYLDPVLIYTAGNLGAVAAVCELYQAMDNVPDGLKVIPMMAAGAGMIPLNKHVLKPLADLVEDHRQGREDNYEGSGIVGWGKSATLAAALTVFTWFAYNAATHQVEPEKCKPNPVTISETGPEQVPGIFVELDKRTRQGYRFFAYRGNKESHKDISDFFDEWDHARGNLCRNTGYNNVRGEDGKLRVVARCREAEKRPKDEEGKVKPPKPPQNYTKLDYSNAKLKQKIKQGKFEKGFLEKLEDMCEKMDMNCMGLLSVMDYETGGTFKPNKKNMAGSTGVGLIQFMAYTARTLGTSRAALLKMTQLEQLVYVEKYFKLNEKGADYSNPLDIAMTIFYPKAVGHGKNYVIGQRKVKSRAKRNNYRQNRGLDYNKDGKITSEEYTRPSLRRGYIPESQGAWKSRKQKKSRLAMRR